MEKRLEINETVLDVENITEENLEEAVAIFTYLNYCPPNILFVFENLLKTASPTEIVLSLTSILKSSQNAAKASSTKVFLKILEVLNLNQYQSIEKLTNNGDNFSYLLLNNSK